MKSRTTRRFREAFAALPSSIRERARSAYRLFRSNPEQPGLQFKKVHPTLSIYSVRIGRGYRAVGTLTGDDVVWFWIGSHSEYDRILRQL